MTDVTDNQPMPDICSFAMEYQPNRLERFWRAMGYHSAHPELPAEAENMPGWCATDIRVRISVADRIRLLISGKAMVRVRTATDVRFDHAISASTFEVVPPYERHS
jgi:hypothetical protein